MYGRNQALYIVIGNAHDVKRQPLRRLVSDAGQAFQFVDEFGDGLGVFQHFANFEFRNSNFGLALTEAGLIPQFEIRNSKFFSRAVHPALEATCRQVYPSLLRPLCGSLR
jgi:hypothetical protein